MTRFDISEQDKEILDKLGIKIAPGMEQLAVKYIALGKVLNAIAKLEVEDSFWVLAEARKAVNSQGDVIENTITEDGTIYPMEIIIDTVAREFRFTVQDIRSAARSNELSKARHVAMYFLRLQNAYTLEQIGKALGDRTPATVSHGFLVIAKIVSDPHGAMDKWILNKIDNIKRYLR